MELTSEFVCMSLTQMYLSADRRIVEPLVDSSKHCEVVRGDIITVAKDLGEIELQLPAAASPPRGEMRILNHCRRRRRHRRP